MMTFSHVFRYVFAAAGLSSALLFSSCGASDEDASSTAFYADSAMSANELSMESAAPSAKAVTGDAAGAGSASSDTDYSAAAKAAADEPHSAMLIRTVNMTAQTRAGSLDACVAALSARVAEVGGYTESSDMSQHDGLKTAWFSIRVPKEKLDEFLNDTASALTILEKSEYTEDISLEYSDVKAHLDMLRSEQEKLMDLLAEAEDIDSVIALDQRLSEVSYEIESQTRRQKHMDNQVLYSTVTIQISESETPGADAGVSDKISAGFKKNLRDTARVLADAFVYTASHLPAILVIVIAAAASLFIARCIIKIKKKKKEKKESPENE